MKTALGQGNLKQANLKQVNLKQVNLAQIKSLDSPVNDHQTTLNRHLKSHAYAFHNKFLFNILKASENLI